MLDLCRRPPDASGFALAANGCFLARNATIDVFDIEPLPPSHPFRPLDNVLATPHIG